MEADPHQLQVVAALGDDVIGTMQLTFIAGLSRKGAWRGQIEGVAGDELQQPDWGTYPVAP